MKHEEKQLLHELAMALRDNTEELRRQRARVERERDLKLDDLYPPKREPVPPPKPQKSIYTMVERAPGYRGIYVLNGDTGLAPSLRKLFIPREEILNTVIALQAHMTTPEYRYNLS